MALRWGPSPPRARILSQVCLLFHWRSTPSPKPGVPPLPEPAKEPAPSFPSCYHQFLYTGVFLWHTSMPFFYHPLLSASFLCTPINKALGKSCWRWTLPQLSSPPQSTPVRLSSTSFSWVCSYQGQKWLMACQSQGLLQASLCWVLCGNQHGHSLNSWNMCFSCTHFCRPSVYLPGPPWSPPHSFLCCRPCPQLLLFSTCTCSLDDVISAVNYMLKDSWFYIQFYIWFYILSLSFYNELWTFIFKCLLESMNVSIDSISVSKPLHCLVATSSFGFQLKWHFLESALPPPWLKQPHRNSLWH